MTTQSELLAHEVYLTDRIDKSVPPSSVLSPTAGIEILLTLGRRDSELGIEGLMMVVRLGNHSIIYHALLSSRRPMDL